MNGKTVDSNPPGNGHRHRPSGTPVSVLRIFLLLFFLSPFQKAQADASTARIWNEQNLSAIRINVPNPPAHARNLFHTAVAMYNSWAAYDGTAVGYLSNEKAAVLPASPAEVELARKETLSYAAYRVLRGRYSSGVGAATTLINLDNTLTSLGYSTTVGNSPLTSAATPAELGKRIGQAILDWAAADQFDQLNYPQPYNSSLNPNLDHPMEVFGTNGSGTENMPLGSGISSSINPNLWQPLDFTSSITQNGIPSPSGPQNFVGVQGLATTPFSLNRQDPARPWLDPTGGCPQLSLPGAASASDAAYKAGALDVLRDSSRLNDNTLIDISPATLGGSTLGTDDGSGYPVNPLTGQPYPANPVKRGDFGRVLGEFWADGPASETPPGHWHVLANEVSDDPDLVKRMRGAGPVLNDLEWDVKMYFALSAATHDAACAAWALKRYYSSARPITMIRYMATKGQSSDPDGLAWDPQGLPLEPGISEVITEATTGSGGRHAWIWDLSFGGYRPGSDYLGQIAVYSWPGEHPLNLPAPSVATFQNHVRWMLGKDWLPFQRKTFNSPAFPGYVSGHSAFSRAAAEALTLLTGSPYFPGGFHKHTFAANSMQIDLGPATAVELQWCRFADAADQAGLSRRWGGIHTPEDDYDGRIVGAAAGTSAFLLAERYWTGAIVDDTFLPALTFHPEGTVTLAWPATRGMFYQVQSSPDLSAWTDVLPILAPYGNAASWTDSAPAPGQKYYRIRRTMTR